MSNVRRLENPAVIERIRKLPLAKIQKMVAVAVYCGAPYEGPLTSPATVAGALSYTVDDVEAVLARLVELGLVVGVSQRGETLYRLSVEGLAKYEESNVDATEAMGE